MAETLPESFDDVDPDIRTFLDQVAADYSALADPLPTDVIERRRIAEKVRTRWTAGGPTMASSVDITLGPKPSRARLHRPTDARDAPVLLYLHGGGWTLFSIDTHDRLMREYAARSGCAVLGIDYSLSPEAQFPTALDECETALHWVRAHGQDHGLDPNRMAIGGDSAGANLALATALRLRDQSQDWIRAILLNYGAFDTDVRPSHDRYGGDAYMLNVPEMMDFWTNYLGDIDIVANPLARPLRADVRDLPPVFQCIAQCDILLDENIALTERLIEAGVDVTAEIYTGATHSFLEAVSISPLADRALADASDWLARILAA
ncbi:alpha/beta hydrolase [Sphingobium subterraneum]|uniref:Acetyl esterase n=1 Tax=Sphingobium subterraneum TaxID=627688 RepID=A0A841IZH6_9SPHN|nr:alpha/beta hydrolase [Sphingobium subterraneum]MBB6123730.1 acetyl esterase [Sphingobium subterraneum]